MKYLLLFIVCCAMSAVAYGQSGSLEGTVIDADTGQPIIFGTVALLKNGKIITGTDTDLDGVYAITTIDPGVYDVEFSYTGYPTLRKENIIIKKKKVKKLDAIMSAGQVLTTVPVTYRTREIVPYFTGVVTNELNGEPLYYVSINVYKEGKQIQQTETSFKGQYEFPLLPKGIYDFKFLSPLGDSIWKRDFEINSHTVQELNVFMDFDIDSFMKTTESSITHLYKPIVLSQSTSRPKARKKYNEKTQEIIVRNYPFPRRHDYYLFGHIIDEASGEPLQLATVTLSKNSKVEAKTQTDVYGRYSFENKANEYDGLIYRSVIAPGDYDIDYSLSGYYSTKVMNVPIEKGKTYLLYTKMEHDPSQLYITSDLCCPPIIDLGDTTQGMNFSASQIRRLPVIRN